MPEVADQQPVITPPDGAEASPETIAEEPAADPAEGQEEPSHEEKPKPRRSAQERIDEITRARHDAEREAEFWRQKALAKPEPPANKPSADQYKDYGEYVEALADWKADQRVSEALAKRDAERASEADVRAKTAGTQAWNERQTAARETIKDYDAVIGKSSIEVAPHVIQALLDSDRGPEVAYHLAKNPEQAARLNGLSPLSAAREIGRLEASVSVSPSPVVKPVSNAPEPITPIRGGVTNSADPSDMSMAQYRAMRAKQGARWAR